MCRILEFLILLLYLEMPIQVTITLSNTLFGALEGEHRVDWSLI